MTDTKDPTDSPDSTRKRKALRDKADLTLQLNEKAKFANPWLHFAVEALALSLVAYVVHLDAGRHIEVLYLGLAPAFGILGIRAKNGANKGSLGWVTAIGASLGVIHNG